MSLASVSKAVMLEDATQLAGDLKDVMQSKNATKIIDITYLNPMSCGIF